MTELADPVFQSIFRLVRAPTIAPDEACSDTLALTFHWGYLEATEASLIETFIVQSRSNILS
jgi:hypothetical protein